MADFDKIINFVKNTNEGGMSVDKGDPGNWRNGKLNTGLFLGTNHGVSGALLCELHPGASDAQIRKMIVNMTMSEAKEIYLQNFWRPSRMSEILNNSIAYQFFDHYINRGNILGLKKLLKLRYPFFETKRFYSLSEAEVTNINKIDSEDFYKNLQNARYNDYGPKYPVQRKRPFVWPYEKKKTKPKSKSSIRNNNSLWDWLTGAANEKKFRI